MILDCHTHRQPPQPQAVVCASPATFSPVPGQLYSLGIHPWNPEEATPENLDALLRLGKAPEVVAIGEAGVDTLRGAPLYRQTLDFRRQIEISEELAKPLVVHDVKAHDIVAGLRRDLRPKQPWIIHGFRGKPSVVEMMLKASADIYFSFGEHWNPDALRAVPRDRLLAETDESPLSIAEIIVRISACTGEEMTHVISANTLRLFRGVESTDYRVRSVCPARTGDTD